MTLINNNITSYVLKLTASQCNSLELSTICEYMTKTYRVPQGLMT